MSARIKAPIGPFFVTVTAILVLCCGRVHAAPPTFQLRARAAEIQGQKPVEQKFSFNFTHTGARVQSDGDAWSDWLTFDETLYKKTRGAYPNNYIKGNPLVVHLTVGGVKDMTVVEAELKFDEAPDRVIEMRGELYGSRLGILIEQDTSAYLHKLLRERNFLQPDGRKGGLRGEYFPNKNFEGDPAFTRVDEEVNFWWAGGTPKKDFPADRFSVRWTGKIKPKNDGEHIFYVRTDDGGRLYLDDELVVDNWGDHAARLRQGIRRLEGGKTYNIKIDYYENGGHSAAQVVWGPAPSPSDILKAYTMAQYNQRYWQHLKNVPFPEEDRPKHFIIVDRFIGGDNDYLDWGEGIENLSRGGFSVIMLPPSKRIRDMLLKQGIRRTAWATYSPPGYAFDHGIKDDPAQVLADWAKKQADQYVNAGYDVKDVAFFTMSDEPGWYLPAQFEGIKKAAVQKRFCEYLKDLGFKPSDLGVKAWDEVQPLGYSSATDLPSKRLYYWTIRFLAWDSTRHFAEATKALEEAFYPNIPIAVNWNNFQGRLYIPGPIFHNRDKKSPDAAMMHHDWLEFGRMRGSTIMWTEDWFGDGMAPQWSYYCARLNSAARKGGIRFGGYVIPRTAGGLEDGVLTKILCIVGSGGKAIKYFVFGPEYNFPSNCYSWKSGQVLPPMARAHRMIGQAEDVLWPGERPLAEVAILFPKSAQVWDPRGVVDATNVRVYSRTIDYMCEIYGIYTGMQRTNIPVDFIEEIDLNPEALKPYKLLFVTAPNIPREYQRSLFKWVKGGGTLVTCAGTGAYDRYNEPTKGFRSQSGVQEEIYARQKVGNVYQLKVVDEGTGIKGDFVAAGSRSKITKYKGKALASFKDGSPAIVENTIGKGRLIHCAFFPGMSSRVDAGLEKLRPWLMYFTEAAEVVPPVKVDQLETAWTVEAPILLSDAGAAVTLLNWSRQPLDELNVAVRLPFRASTVESVTHGKLKFERIDTGVEFKLALKYADVIKIKP